MQRNPAYSNLFSISFQAGIKRPALTDIMSIAPDHVWSGEKPNRTLTPVVRQMQILTKRYPNSKIGESP